MPEYSISQLGKFEECALQYKFIYVDGIKRYEEGAPCAPDFPRAFGGPGFGEQT